MNKISIILPVYNVDKYLERCLSSIKPYIDAGHQLIIVNDGSTDESQIIIDAFCKKNQNVIWIQQVNQGPSVARNNGMGYVTGDYIWFVDSDDYIEDITVKLEVLLKDSPDVLVLGRTEEYNTWDVCTPHKIGDAYYESGKDYLKDSIDHGLFRTEVWDKIFKRSLLENNQLSFVEGLLYEDMYFTVSAFMSAQNVVTTRLYPYHYIHYNTGSITKTIRKKDLDVLKFVQLLDDFMDSQPSNFNNTSKEYHKLIFNWVSSCLLNKYSWLSLYNQQAQEIFLETTSNTIFMRSVEYCASHNIGIRQKLFANLLLKSPILYKIILSLALKIQRIKLRLQSN